MVQGTHDFSLDLGEVGDALSKLVAELKVTDSENENKGIMGWLKRSNKGVEQMKAKYARTEKDVDEDVRWLRKDERLDALRVPGYADILIADFLLQDELVPAEICATGIEGPFLTGVLAEEFRGHPLFETLKCLPYMLQNEFRLLVVQAGNNLSRQDQERIEKIRAFYDSAGVDFGGMNIRS